MRLILQCRCYRAQLPSRDPLVRLQACLDLFQSFASDAKRYPQISWKCLGLPRLSGSDATTGVDAAAPGILAGGEGGIRTPDTLSGMPVFKTGAINHSATSPTLSVY